MSKNSYLKKLLPRIRLSKMFTYTVRGELVEKIQDSPDSRRNYISNLTCATVLPLKQQNHTFL